MARSFDDDPLTRAIAPPKDETPAQKHAREVSEAEARRVSDEIDEQLKKERDAEKKKKPFKLLLLGQSESGKTATLKNFQLTYARKEWAAERASWRSVVYLNLLRNVNDIVSMMSSEISRQSRQTHTFILPSSPMARPTTANTTMTELTDDGTSIYERRSTRTPLAFRDRHHALQHRLASLRTLQVDLERRLGAATSEPTSTDTTSAAPFPQTPEPIKHEFSINSRNGWKSVLKAVTRMNSGYDEAMRLLQEQDNETADAIGLCKEDIRRLWEDPVVKEMLSRRKTRLEDSPGFFLNDLDRIVTRNYQPTDDDIIRARLRTLGVQEYHFVFEFGRSIGQEWRLYDVGGARSSRAAWYSYFDDADGLIFLAPVSCFDEKLAEDKRINRLEDSYLLWRAIVSCKLLSRTQLILFLNKCDLLQAKLQRGVQIRDSVPSFGDRKNDLSTATKYFQQHFKEIMKQHSPVRRTLYMHLTSVIDTRATATTLAAVEESILRNQLRRAELM